MGTGNVEEYNMGHSVSHRGKWGFGRFVSFICGGREDRLEPSIREVTAMDGIEMGDGFEYAGSGNTRRDS